MKKTLPRMKPTKRKIREKREERERDLIASFEFSHFIRIPVVIPT